MRFSVASALALVSAAGCIEPPSVDLNAATQPVIGGAAAPAGKWPDTAAILWSGEQACTGTLIAPNLVVTAGHCVLGGAPDHVLVGASRLSAPEEGQTLAIQKWVEYPSSQSTVDAAILILAEPATGIEPRAIASGWAKLDIVNGAPVQLVGFGTIDKDGSVSTDALMEATTTITDYNCSMSAGCSTGAKPDGELGAGGMGVDTCPGDSGGPVYLLTDYGTFLTGITSRGYDTNQYACSEGGIYERPDKILDWMEKESGVKIARGPTPTFDPIAVLRGDAAETKIEPNDPKSSEHAFEITKQPGYAKAAVRADGTVRVCADPGVVGRDSLEVTVTDKGDPGRKLALTIPIDIVDGEPPDSCDVNAFGGEGGGCCDTRRSAGGSIPLAMVVLLALRRRRK